jgi:hypothetical protein
VTDEQDEIAEEQHQHAHRLADVIQRAIEDYQADNDLLPGTILFALHMQGTAWQHFCRQLGMSMDGALHLAAHAASCSAELRDYLQLYAPRFTEYLQRVEEEAESAEEDRFEVN